MFCRVIAYWIYTKVGDQLIFKLKVHELQSPESNNIRIKIDIVEAIVIILSINFIIINGKHR